MPNTSGVLTSLIPNPENLYKRIRMTGKQWTLRQYAGASAALVVIVTLFLLLRGFSPLLAIFLGLFVGLGLPHKVIGFLINKRITRFTVNFPDALELLVRGLRSGLPISETDRKSTRLNSSH